MRALRDCRWSAQPPAALQSHWAGRMSARCFQAVWGNPSQRVLLLWEHPCSPWQGLEGVCVTDFSFRPISINSQYRQARDGGLWQQHTFSGVLWRLHSPEGTKWTLEQPIQGDYQNTKTHTLVKSALRTDIRSNHLPDFAPALLHWAGKSSHPKGAQCSGVYVQS